MLRALILLCLTSLLSGSLSAQSSMVTASYSDEPMVSVLKDIKSKTGVRLAYDVTNMRNLRVTADLEAIEIAEALSIILTATDYEALFLNDTWLIIPRVARPPDSEIALRKDISVSGRLTDRSSGEPLAYANVAIRDTRLAAVTNLEGYFNIPDVPSDSLTVCFSYVGFRNRCITLSGLDTEQLMVRLDRADTYLKPVEILDYQSQDISKRPRDEMMKMDAAMIARISSGPQPDLFQAVQRLPGVSSGNALDAQLHIRGGNEDENLVQWDGFTLYHLDHFFGVFSTLNPSVIKQVQLLNGPYDAQSGGRSGGVLDIIGKSGNRYDWNTRLESNLIQSSILTEGPITKKSSILLSYRRSHTDLIRSALYQDLLEGVFAQSIVNTSPDLVNEERSSSYYYYDLNAKWIYEPTDRDKISISLFQGKDDFIRRAEFRYEPTNSPLTLNDILTDDSEWGNTGLGAQWYRTKSEGRSHQTSIGWSQYASNYLFEDRQRDFFNGIPLPSNLDTEIEENVLEDLTIRHARSKNLPLGQLKYGYQFTNLNVNQVLTERILADGSIRLRDSTSHSNQHTVFADRDWRLSARFSFRAGGRLTVNSYTNRLYAEPRLRADYRINDVLSVYLATGKYVQQVRRTAEQNLFLRQPDHWQLSNRSTVPESKSWHSSIGLQLNKGQWTVAGDLFYKQLKGVIYNQGQERLISAFTVENEELSMGDGEVAGVDLLVQYSLRSHSAYLSYSYTYSANRMANVNEGREFPSPYNKPHDLKFNYNFRARDYVAYADLRASSGYAYTPDLGFFESPGGDTFIVYGDDLSARLPHIFRIDIGLSRKFHFENHDVTLGFGVYNLTDNVNIRNRSYELAQMNDDLPDDLRINAVDLELIGFSPTFNLIFNLH